MQKVLSFGEVLWDVIDGQAHIGGAPFNLAGHLAQLGKEAYLYSKIGRDPLGCRVREEIAARGVKADYLKIDGRYATGTAIVTLNGAGIPSYTFPDGAGYQHIDTNAATLLSLQNEGFFLFCFGSMVQMAEESRRTLFRILETCQFHDVFFDANIRRDFCPREMAERSLRYATILKLNEEETQQFSSLFAGGAGEAGTVRSLFAQFARLRCVLVTKGPRGCTVYSREETREINECISKAVDTVGAGDAFSAGFISGLLCGHDWFRSARRGAVLSDFVAASSGAIPAYPAALLDRLRTC